MQKREFVKRTFSYQNLPYDFYIELPNSPEKFAQVIRFYIGRKGEEIGALHGSYPNKTIYDHSLKLINARRATRDAIRDNDWWLNRGIRELTELLGGYVIVSAECYLPVDDGVTETFYLK